jgi:hypothetical protein
LPVGQETKVDVPAADPSPTLPGLIDGPGLLEICGARIAGLYALWDAKRAGRRMPARRDFDVAELKPWLGWIAMYDVAANALSDGHDFRYRLVGTNFVRYHNTDPTGQRVSESGLATDRRAMLENLRGICAARLPRYRSDNLPCVDMRTYTPPRLYLPLAEDGETVDMILLLGADPLDASGHVAHISRAGPL